MNPFCSTAAACLLIATTLLQCSTTNLKIMDLTTLEKINTEEVVRLASGTAKDKHESLIFDGSPMMKTVVYKPGPLVIAPFSQTPCIYYEVMVFDEKFGANFFIGRTESKEPFYVLVKNKLVKTGGSKGVVHLDDFGPTFKQTYEIGKEPETIQKAMRELGFYGELGVLESSWARPFSDYTVVEQVFLPKHVYTLTIAQYGYAIPPDRNVPGSEPTYGYGYHFYFK